MTEYYIDLGYKDVRMGLYDNFEFDEAGIPLFRYKFGSFYNITFICHFALYHYTLYLKYKRSDDLEKFKRVSVWIISHGTETEDSFEFPYEFPWNGLSPPWISALGQGRMLSVLVRAHELTGQKRYLEVAKKALKPFEISIPKLGVQTHFPDGNIAFAEYPLQKPDIALNGFITSLIGLFDLAHLGQDGRASELFKMGLHALESNLHRYDLGYWSTYDLTRFIPAVASDGYHQYHIMQLWALYELSGHEIFKKYARKWQTYRKGPIMITLRTISRAYRLLRLVYFKTYRLLKS